MRLHQLQQQFLDLRFGMFLHFNMATFQDREWGDPNGDRELFDPTDLDTDQWAAAAKSAGMTYGCLTTKHHDGFCIWPTTTRSAHVEADRDVVRAYVDSFRSVGLQVGLYYSILDLRADIRHFCITPEKIELIKAQLTELLTNYGPIHLLVIDGWDAPWSRITYEEIPFHEIYALVKKLQPDCLISELNASQYPSGALYYSDIKAYEQNAGQFLPDDSRLPAQSCVTLTDGWFWKTSDITAELKSAKQVVKEWLVPQNDRHCNLLVNAPPSRAGRLEPNVVARLKGIGALWSHSGPAAPVGESVVITAPNLATGQPIFARSCPDCVGPDLANDGNFSSSWHLPEGETSGWLEVRFDEAVEFDTLVLVERSPCAITDYSWETWNGDEWVVVVSGNRPHSVQIDRVPRAKADRIRLLITGTTEGAGVAEIGFYLLKG